MAEKTEKTVAEMSPETRRMARGLEAFAYAAQIPDAEFVLALRYLLSTRKAEPASSSAEPRGNLTGTIGTSPDRIPPASEGFDPTSPLRAERYRVMFEGLVAATGLQLGPSHDPEVVYETAVQVIRDLRRGAR